MYIHRQGKTDRVPHPYINRLKCCGSVVFAGPPSSFVIKACQHVAFFVVEHVFLCSYIPKLSHWDFASFAKNWSWFNCFIYRQKCLGTLWVGEVGVRVSLSQVAPKIVPGTRPQSSCRFWTHKLEIFLRKWKIIQFCTLFLHHLFVSDSVIAGLCRIAVLLCGFLNAACRPGNNEL